jgi:hypothetical protein
MLETPLASSPVSGYTLEITTITGETAAVVDLPAHYVRPADDTDIRHTRRISQIA